jgi:hypothetical protein
MEFAVKKYIWIIYSITITIFFVSVSSLYLPLARAEVKTDDFFDEFSFSSKCRNVIFPPESSYGIEYEYENKVDQPWERDNETYTFIQGDKRFEITIYDTPEFFISEAYVKPSLHRSAMDVIATKKIKIEQNWFDELPENIFGHGWRKLVFPQDQEMLDKEYCDDWMKEFRNDDYTFYCSTAEKYNNEAYTLHWWLCKSGESPIADCENSGPMGSYDWETGVFTP